MLKKVLGLTFAAMLLSSCDPAPKTGADGYRFGTPQYEKQQVQINIVTYNSERELLQAASSYGVKAPDLAAFSVLRPPFDTCTIHMVKPSVKYEPEFVGHEFLHCVYGQWHTDNESRS
jgi:hypothetical protein